MLGILHISLISIIITLAAGCVMWYFAKNEFDFDDVYNEAFALYKRKSFRAAAAQFKLALSACPNKVNAQYNLGLCYLKLKEYNQAKKLFAAAHKLRPNDFDVLYNLAYVELLSNNFEEAKIYFEQALDMVPDDSDVLFNLGYIAAQQQQPNLAMDFLKKAMAIASDRVSYKRYYLDILNLVFELSGDIGILEEITTIGGELVAVLPTDEELMFLLAVAFAKSGNWENSIEYCQKMFDINPNTAKGCNQYGLTLFCKGNTTQAIEMYERAISLDSTVPDFYLNLVFAYDKIDEYDKMEKLIDKFIKLFPNDPNVEMVKDYLDRR